MRAVRCTRHGSVAGLTIEELPDPVPGPGEVVVGVRAAAANYPDVLIVANSYQVSIPVPFTPGSEFAGEVLAVGPDVDAAWNGRPVMGAAMTGAFAEMVVASAGSLTVVPDGLDFVQAAAFRVTYHTAYHALVTIGEADADDWIVVLGAAGGVGTAGIDVASRLGMRVIAVASSAERVSLGHKLGAVAGIDYSHEDVKERIKQLSGSGADVVVDPAGGANAEAALRATRWGGRFVTVGYASGEIPRIPLNLVLLKGVIVRGFELRTLPVYLPGAEEEAAAGLASLVRGGMRPYVSRVYPMEEAAEALGDLQQRRALGKVVIEVSGR
jgi:NADPH2:quinone reductase